MSDHVAIYVRISQDDGEKEDVLANHRTQLIRLAESYNYSYDLYEEVMSGEKLINRKQIRKLLENIEDYAAVLVMDLDRLSRDDYEASQIKQTLFMNDIRIVTPGKVYDLDNDADETLFSFQSLVAKMELKQIRKRFKRGKLQGAREGRWTNGTPPLGYNLNPETKRLEINEEEAQIIRRIKELALKGYPAEAISIQLEEEGVNGRSGKRLSGPDVYQILKRKTYRGYITLKNRNKRGEIIEEIETPKAHEALVTEEEYLLIRKHFDSRRSYEKKSKVEGWSILQGLVFCRCGAKLGFQPHHNKENPYIKLRGCHAKDILTREICTCSGVKAEYVEKIVLKKVKILKEMLEEYLVEYMKIDPEERMIQLKKDLKSRISQKNKIVEKNSKLIDLHLEGIITKAEFISRKDSYDGEIKRIENECQLLEIELGKLNIEEQKKKIENMVEFISNIDEVSEKEVNIFLKTIMNRIVYWREVPKILPTKDIPRKDKSDYLLRNYPVSIHIDFAADMIENGELLDFNNI